MVMTDGQYMDHSWGLHINMRSHTPHSLSSRHLARPALQEAFAVWDEMLNGDLYPYATYFYNLTASM